MKLDAALEELKAASDEALAMASALSAKNQALASELEAARDRIRRAAGGLKSLRVELKNGQL